MMDRCDVNGEGTSPLYQLLKGSAPTVGKDIRWNFDTKWLLNGDATEVRGGELVASPHTHGHTTHTRAQTHTRRLRTPPPHTDRVSGSTKA